MRWEVVNRDSSATPIRAGLFLPIGNSHRRSDPRRILEIIIGGVAVSPPDNETNDGNKKNKQDSNCSNDHGSRQLAGEQKSQKKYENKNSDLVEGIEGAVASGPHPCAGK